METTTRLSCVVATVAAVGCGAESHEVPWEPDRVTVVQPGEQVIEEPLPEGDDCIAVDAGADECIQPQTRCESGGAADIVLDEDGNLLDIVCLPPNAEVISPGQLADGEIPQNANNTAVDFDEGTFEGDLDVDANNVVLYGDDPDEATLDGDLAIMGNNAVVRGLTVDGDVTVAANNATFVFCRITGDLTVPSNNTVVSGCEIHGDVIIRGNNTELRGNLVGGTLDGSGKNTECDGNRSFDDRDDNGVIDKDEIDGAVGC